MEKEAVSNHLLVDAINTIPIVRHDIIASYVIKAFICSLTEINVILSLRVLHNFIND